MQNVLAATHHAADIRTNLNVELSSRLRSQHRVVADHVPHFEFGQIKAPGNLRDDFIGQESNFVLRIEQRWHQRRPLRRIMRNHLRESLLEFVREFHKKLSDCVIGRLRDLKLMMYALPYVAKLRKSPSVHSLL